MSIEVQLRRGTSAQNSVFTGQVGELIYTTDTKQLFIHDGTTVGGISTSGGAASLPDDSVTFAKIEEIANQTILGNNTGSSSDILELTPTQVRAIINVADGATANDSDANLKNRSNHTGSQLLATISDAGTAAASNTGDFAAASHNHTAANITDFDTKVANNSAVAANTAKISYTDSAAVALNTAKVTNATHTGEVTGSSALTIANGVVDSANLSTTLDFGSIA